MMYLAIPTILGGLWVLADCVGDAKADSEYYSGDVIGFLLIFPHLYAEFANPARFGLPIRSIHKVSACALPQSTIPLAEPACRNDIKTNEVIGTSLISKPPFTIVARNKSTVTFTVEKQWASNGSVYVQYFDLHQKQYECVELCNKPDNVTITAHCMKKVPIAVIELWVETDVVSDTAKVSSCCSSLSSNGRSLTSKNYVEGTYELWCECHENWVDRQPSNHPTLNPSPRPTHHPSLNPSPRPSATPSIYTTRHPTISPAPTVGCW